MNEEPQVLRKLYRYGVATRFLAGFVGWLLMLFTDLQLIQDAAYYNEIGVSIADDWLNGRQSEWLLLHSEEAHQPWLIVIGLGCFYFLTQGVQALPIVLLVFAAFTALATRYTYLIGREVGADSREASVGAWIVAITPAFVFWAGALYKEGIILVVLSGAVYHLLLLQRAWNGRSLLLLSVCILALSGLRLYLAAIVATTMIVGLAFGRQNNAAQPLRHVARSTRSAKRGADSAIAIAGNTSRESAIAVASTIGRQFVIVLLFIALLVGIGFTDAVQRMLPEDLQSGLDKIHTSRSDLASADSGYLPDADISTLESAVSFLPVGLVYFLTVPLPWHLGSFRQNIAIPDTAMWILLYPVIVVGISRGLRVRFQETMLIIVITAAICCFYALFIGNIGTAYRMRIQVWILWAPFVGIGWTQVSAWFRHSSKLSRKSEKAVAGT